MMNKRIENQVLNTADIAAMDEFELVIGINDILINIEETSAEFTASNQPRVYFSILAEVGQKKKQKLKLKYLIKDEVYVEVPTIEQFWVIAPNRYIGLIESTTSKKGKKKNAADEE